MNIHQHTPHEPKILIEIESFTKRITNDGLKREDLPELVELLDAFGKIYCCNHVYIDYLGLFEHLANYEFFSFKQIKDGHYTYISLLEICDRLLEHYSWLFQVNKKKVLSDLRQYKFGVKCRFWNVKPQGNMGQNSGVMAFHFMYFVRYSTNWQSQANKPRMFVCCCVDMKLKSLKSHAVNQ